MFAQTYALNWQGNRTEEMVHFVNSTVLPFAKTQKGFKGARFLVDRKSGKGLGLIFWASQADLEAAVRAEQAQRASAQTQGVEPRNTGGNVEEYYEVAIDVPAA